MTGPIARSSMTSPNSAPGDDVQALPCRGGRGGVGRRGRRRPAERGVVPLPDHLTVTEQHRAYQRVRRDPAPPFQGKLNRPVHCFEFSHNPLLNIEYPIMNIE